MANYCSLDEVKAELDKVDEGDDAILQGMIEDVKIFIDDYCNRRFDTVTSTPKYFDGAGIVLFIDDLISIDTAKTGTATATTANHLIDTTKNQFTAADVGKPVYNSTDKTVAIITAYNSATDVTLDTDIMASGEGYVIGGFRLDTDGDGVYESGLATTDYILYPLNKTPKTRIKISPNSNYGSFASGVKKGVQITGTWGYSSTVHKTVKRCAIIQVLRWFERKKANYAVKAVGSEEFGAVEIYHGLDPDIKLMLEPLIKRNL